MGHANLENISRFFVRRLYAKGTLSIDECAKALSAAGETYHASEGEYDDEFMLTFGLCDVVWFLCGGFRDVCPPQREKIIKPANPTSEERSILKAWEKHEDMVYQVLDNIRWRFSPGWRKKYRDIPILSNITH